MILDATALLLLLNKDTSPPKHPETKEPIADAHERVVALVNELTLKGETILIASPVLAELLVRAENAANGYIEEFNSSSRFKIVSFDQKAAIEHAICTRKALDEGDKFGGIPDGWSKIKFDRQIVAIAIASGAHTVCTDDGNLRKHAEKQGLKVIGISELTLNEQTKIAFIDSVDVETNEDVTNAIEVSNLESDAVAESSEETTEADVAALPLENLPIPKKTDEAIVEIAPPVR